MKSEDEGLSTRRVILVPIRNDLLVSNKIFKSRTKPSIWPRLSSRHITSDYQEHARSLKMPLLSRYLPTHSKLNEGS